MCYAIPGKIILIDGKFVTLEYFGEKRRARNEFYALAIGEYVYAQGGFIVQKIEERAALSALELWKEVFVVLKERDLRLVSKPKTLYQTANAKRQQVLGNSCCVHGIIEFSNYCVNDCLYCGIRKSNSKVKRYRMSIEEILAATKDAVSRLGFKALVFQSGECPYYTDEMLVDLVKSARDLGILVTMSVGERSIESYKKMYDAGARSVLLRFETSNKKLFGKIKPESDFDKRINLIKALRDMGYLVMTGFLIGLPGQTEQDTMEDIKLTGELQTEMFSFGPFLPHPETPLKSEKSPSLEMCLNTIARARIMFPESKIVVTTALETLEKNNGAKAGLMAGANSLMVNITPEKYRRCYEIYPERACNDVKVADRIKYVINLLNSLGRAPTDIGI